MPALGFMLWLTPNILDGSKVHTIRVQRKRPIKPLDTLIMQTGRRTKNCKTFFVATCVQVDPIQIFPAIDQVTVDGHALMPRQIDALAKRDGFLDANEFFAFFRKYPLETLEREMVLIWWDDAAAKKFNREVKHGSK